MKKQKYSLYLASGIKLWKDYFKKEYSSYFNKRVALFEPGTINTPKEHRKIPITIACYDLNEINKCDAVLAFMKKYRTLDGSPAGTDSTWEFGYAIGKGKPTIVLIENEEHLDYYASQWMVSFSINAILTCNAKVAELVKNHPKFVHAKLIFCQHPEQFENKISVYLDEYYRSIYSRSGIVNYYVDKSAREIFSREKFNKVLNNIALQDRGVQKILEPLKNLSFDNDSDNLKVCIVGKNIADYYSNKLNLVNLNSGINGILTEWGQSREVILDCLEHSIKPSFKKVLGRKQGIKKTRPELFYELYDLVTHHLIEEQRFVKNPSFPYEIGALIEFYNWANTYSIDDVFDNSESRQNELTVWKKFSRRDAIFTGILAHLLTLKFAFIIASENKFVAKRIAIIMNNCNYIMYSGQIFDIALTVNKNKMSIFSKNTEQLYKLYTKRIYGICGVFYESIGELSVKTANKEEQIMNGEEIEKTSPIVGMYYGLIQMIRNDLGDYIFPSDFNVLSKGMKGISHSDVEEGKLSLQYIVALDSKALTKREKDFLIKCFDSKLTLKKKIRINSLIWKSGAIDLVVYVIQGLIKHVKQKHLPVYHETPTRMKWMFDLIEITDKIVIPFKKQAEKFNWIKFEYNSELAKKILSELISLENKSKEERLFYFEEINLDN